MNHLKNQAACVVALIALSASSAFTGRAAEVPADGLALWLKADTGLTLNGSAVSEWADQSGQSRNAAQTAPANQPTLVTTLLGKPGLRFDGINDFLTFNLPVNDLTGMSIFLVANSTLATGGGGSQAGDAAIFWNETAPWGTVYLSPFQNQVNVRFGTREVGNRHIHPRPAAIGADFSITTAIHSETVDSLYIDGQLAFEAGDKSPVLAGNRDIGNLGRGFNDNTYFAGDIAEVLVYTRAVSDTERQQIEQYLTTKYFSNALPLVNLTNPANNAVFTAPTDITISADASDAGGTISKVEFFRGNTKLGEDTSSPYSLTWSNVPPGSYTLTVKAIDNQGAFKTSAPVLISVNPSAGGGPTFTGMALWVKADAGVTLSGETVSEWADQSGQERHPVQAAAASQPALVTGAVGKPAIRFDGLNDFLTFNLPVNNLTGMTILLVANSRTVQAGGPFQAAILWNETAGWGTVYLSPFQNQVNFRFGTTQVGNSHDIPRPTPIGLDYSITAAMHNDTTDTLFIDGQMVFEAGDKSPALAGNRDGGSIGGGFNDTYFGGDIAEVLVYTRALSDIERRTVEQYLTTKYFSNKLPTVSITSPANNVSITAPVNITITADASDTDGAVSKVEFFQGNTKLGEDTSSPYSLTWNNVAAGNYSLTAKATDNGGAFRISSPINVTVSGTSPDSPPIAGLGLWLKADVGVVLNGSTISQWMDQSGQGRDAAQATAASQPTLAPGLVNGKPALVFDGIDDFLTFTLPVNELQDMTIFLVSACSEDIDVSFPFVARGALFWNETASWGTIVLSPFQSVVRWRFGVGQPQDLNELLFTRPTPLVNAFSTTVLVREGATTGTETLFVNSELALSVSEKTAPVGATRNEGNLGRGWDDNSYFPGSIAEVLVYTRALAETERQIVERYLKSKYFASSATPAGRQVLYKFQEGSGGTINDVSGTGAPLNLAVSNPSAVRWLQGGGLAVDSPVLIASADAATKVIESCKSSNEITIEAWITPANVTQAGPARVVSLSQDTLNRNFTLGQQAADYQTRLRTTDTGNNGSNPSVTAAGTVKTALSHVVYTRAASGEVKLYLDGVAQTISIDTITGDFSNWNSSMRLALANELTSDRPWLGELHLVAIYSRALAAVEVKQNFDKGLGTTAPPLKFNATSRDPVGNLVISWTGTGALEQADGVTGPWSPAPNQNNPQTVTPTAPARFFRLKK
ncbi:MAG: Ig-like domain-containing protein [Verrucomicrobiales bacterium]|nr:Ig-like domain-containing protein [Verrucomicrobiales bacterium]